MITTSTDSPARPRSGEAPELTRRPAFRRLLWAIVVAYAVALALIAFWPTPVDKNLGGSLSTALAWIHDLGGPRWLRYNTVEFLSNIVLFLPIGLFVTALARPGRWWLALLLGLSATVTIELGQHLFLPARFASVYDLLANTLGAALGVALGLAVRFALRNRSRRRNHPGQI
jgi:glycopeptide antibiotics resistance protein